MVKALKLAVASAVFLFPFVYPHGALAWTALSYEEAVWMCSVGNLQAGANRGESGYVGYEMWVRGLETRVGTIVGASGCFFASRREL